MEEKVLSQNSIRLLQYLYDNRIDGYLDSEPILNQLKLPESCITELDKRLQPLIDGKPALRFPRIKISTAGIRYIEKSVPVSQLLIESKCETIFQLHKEQSSVLWHDSTYHLIGQGALDAMRKMVRQGVIYEDYQGMLLTTRLEPDLYNATSYTEALRMIKESKNSPISSSAIIIGGDNYGAAIAANQSDVDLNLNPIINPPTTPIKPDTKQGTKNKLIDFILQNLVALIIAVVAGLIVAYIMFIRGWN